MHAKQLIPVDWVARAMAETLVLALHRWRKLAILPAHIHPVPDAVDGGLATGIAQGSLVRGACTTSTAVTYDAGFSRADGTTIQHTRSWGVTAPRSLAIVK
jgi:hypothetical protein